VSQVPVEGRDTHMRKRETDREKNRKRERKKRDRETLLTRRDRETLLTRVKRVSKKKKKTCPQKKIP
jgi:hypothetical protein